MSNIFKSLLIGLVIAFIAIYIYSIPFNESKYDRAQEVKQTINYDR